MSCEIKLAQIGDIHLFHPKTTTREIIKGLRRAFPRDSTTAELDIIFIVGDVFDRLLTFADENTIEARVWINGFLRMCKEYDIVLRVLRGTPGHDWEQPKQFVVENELSQIGADVKYVNNLEIEYIERFGLNVLYIPDEWKHEPDDTWKDVKRALADKGLKKVDLVAMHGAFSYQLPPQVSENTHKPERYIGITNHYVMVGHVHKRSQYEKILAAGSFDRLTHGEEEPKGHYRITLDKKLGNRVTFVENKLAKQYVTLDCCGLNFEEVFAKISALDLPKGSCIRLMGNPSDVVINALDVISKNYLDYKFTPKRVEGTEKKVNAVNEIFTPYTPPAITQDNVFELLMSRLAKRQLDPLLTKRAGELLNEHLVQGTQ